MADDEKLPAHQNPPAVNPYQSPATPEPTDAEPAADDANPGIDKLLGEAAILYQQGRNGANWFYWVAALSLVNSAIMHAGGDIHFVVGLGLTLLVDVIAGAFAVQDVENATAIKGAAIVFDLVVAAAVAGVGWLANRRYLIVFIMAMVLYALDALIFLLFGDLMSIGFHAFALWGMWNGLTAFRKLNAFERALQEELPHMGEDAAPA